MGTLAEDCLLPLRNGSVTRATIPRSNDVPRAFNPTTSLNVLASHSTAPRPSNELSVTRPF